MRACEGKRRPNSAPRYEALEGETAAQIAAHDDRRAEAARAEAAQFFHDLRRGLRMARVAIANRVGTDPDIIEALEAGALDCLPAWPEIVRVVSRYTQLAQLDPRPVLHALHFAVQHRQQVLARESLAQRWCRKLRSSSGKGSTRQAGRSATLQWVAGIGVPAVLVGSLMLTSGLQASQLRGSLASMLGLEPATRAESIKRLEGLVWIDAADPRKRRGDKLPGHSR